MSRQHLCSQGYEPLHLKDTTLKVDDPLNVGDLTWLISLVREFWVADGIENGLLLGGNIGGEGLRGAVDGDGG